MKSTTPLCLDTLPLWEERNQSEPLPQISKRECSAQERPIKIIPGKGPRNVKDCQHCGQRFEALAKRVYCSRRCSGMGSKGFTPDMERKMVEMYQGGYECKAIAKEILGRESAKSTIKSMLIAREALEDRNPQQARRSTPVRRGELKETAAQKTIRIASGLEKTKPKQRAVNGLSLFKFRDKVKARGKYPQYQSAANSKSVDAGFKSSYHQRYSEDLNFRLKEVLKRRFRKFVSSGSGGRMGALVGCSMEEFKSHIESQWDHWMTWDNLGPSKEGFWQIDHIIPCSWFTHSDEEHLRICWHYSNLRPLGAVANNARRASPDDVDGVIARLPESAVKVHLIEQMQSRLSQ